MLLHLRHRAVEKQTRTVGGGLPTMNDDAIFLRYRVDCIAGKPPPTARSRRHLSSQRQRHTLTATNTQGRKAFFGVAFDHFVQQGDQYAAA